MKTRYNCILLFLLLNNIVQCSESAITIPAIGYGVALALDMCSAVSEKIRYGLYGDIPLSAETEKKLRTIVSNLNLPQPTNIRQSYWPWDMVAGTIFSNHDTLFVNEKICNDIAGLKKLDDNSKKELITAMLMIGSQYDSKLIALSVATPIAVWVIAKILYAVTKKINAVMPLDYATHIAHKLSKKFNKSFKAKALTSASLLGAYIFYQRYSFGIQAQAMIK